MSLPSRTFNDIVQKNICNNNNNSNRHNTNDNIIYDNKKVWKRKRHSCVCCATLMGVHVGLRKVVLVSPFMVQTGSCFTGRLGNTVTLQFVFVAMLVFELVRTKGGGSTTAWLCNVSDVKQKFTKKKKKRHWKRLKQTARSWRQLPQERRPKERGKSARSGWQRVNDRFCNELSLIHLPSSFPRLLLPHGGVSLTSFSLPFLLEV